MSPDPTAANARHQAYRIAFAVTLGLVSEWLRGGMLPPLAPVIAIQLLATMKPCPPPKAAIGLALIMIGSIALAWIVAVLTVPYGGLYTIGVGLLYLWGFWLAARPKTAMIGTMVVTMSVVVTALVAASQVIAGVTVIELLRSVVIGIVLVYLAHAVFPHRAPAKRPPEPPADVISPFTRALVAVAIILPLHLYLTADGLAAILVLMTVASMLQQRGIARSVQFSMGFAMGNLAGAALAAVGVLVISLNDSVLVIASVAAASTLILAGQIVRSPAFAAVFVPGLVAWTILFGLPLSHLPLPEEVAVLDRFVMVVLGTIYALAAASLIVPFVRRRLQTEAP